MADSDAGESKSAGAAVSFVNESASASGEKSLAIDGESTVRDYIKSPLDVWCYRIVREREKKT